MKCARCEAYYQKYPLKKIDGKEKHVLGQSVYSDPIRCAFTKGKFSTDNWNCGTLNALRGLLYNEDGTPSIWAEWKPGPAGTFMWRDDFGASSIGVLYVPGANDYILMLWYKERGAVGQAWLVSDDHQPKLLTLEAAEEAIEAVARTRRAK